MGTLEHPPSAPETPPAARSRWLLWALAALLGAVLVAGLVAGLLREPAAVDPASPEGVVQTYLQAVLDGDVASARSLLTPRVATRCSTREFHQAWVAENLAATLAEVTPGDTDDEITVAVRLRAVEGPSPFGAGGYATTEAFVLTETSDGWRISDDPWPLYDCGGSR